MDLTESITYLQKNPILHITNIQGVKHLEPYQKKIIEAVAKHQRVAISACHDVGKTFTLAKIVLWACSSFPGTKIITTAPTFTQVEKLLWAEIRHGFQNSRSPLGGKILETEWKIDDDWFAIGVSPKDDGGDQSTQGAGSRFQGFHGEQVIIIFDEATGVHSKRWIQAEGMMTSHNVKFIAIGNPTSRNTEFFKCFQSPEWFKLNITCFDSPNLIANGFKSIRDIQKELVILEALTDQEKLKRLRSYKVTQPKLLTSAWVIAKALIWGINHPLFLSKVLGKFPRQDDNALFPIDTIEEAQRRQRIDDGLSRSIGVDPARFGADSTVITMIEGNTQKERIELNKKDTAHITGAIIDLVKRLPRRSREVIVVDGTGIGSGVIDQLMERQGEEVIPSHIEIREIHFGERCPIETDRNRYANLKAKLFYDLADDLKSDLAILPESIYLEQLPTIIYRFDSKGRYKIESKEEYKKRTTMGSPDDADALAIANYGRYEEEEVGNFLNIVGSDTSILTGSDTIAGGLQSENKW